MWLLRHGDGLATWAALRHQRSGKDAPLGPRGARTPGHRPRGARPDNDSDPGRHTPFPKLTQVGAPHVLTQVGAHSCTHTSSRGQEPPLFDVTDLSSRFL